MGVVGALVCITLVDNKGRRYMLLRTIPFIALMMMMIGTGMGLHNYSDNTSLQ